MKESRKNSWKREIQINPENKEETGSFFICTPLADIRILLIDIHSRTIPDITDHGAVPASYMTINCCLKGRCEVALKNGEYTYLSSKEIAIDTGTAYQENTAFYYPGGEYCGYEIIIVKKEDNGWKFMPEGIEVDAFERIWNICEPFERPRIITADSSILQCMSLLEEDIRKGEEKMPVILDVFRILYMLLEEPLEEEKRRDYYTRSQTAIAKKTMEIITGNLNQRVSASSLASQFGISETSLKNYFRGVFGCGYSQFQKDLRMKKAAQYLLETDQSIGEIADLVGFSTQSKFTLAFKAYYGVTPLEYKRRKRLEERKEEEQ